MLLRKVAAIVLLIVSLAVIYESLTGNNSIIFLGPVVVLVVAVILTSLWRAKPSPS